MGSCEEGAEVNLGSETGGTSGVGNVENPRDALRDSDHMFVAPCDNRGADACSHQEFVAPCDNLVASYDNTGAHTAVFEFVAPCDNLVASCDNTGADIAVSASGSSSTYSGRVPFLPVVPRGSVVLCNNLVTPCDNEVEQGRSPTPDGGEETAPEPHAR